MGMKQIRVQKWTLALAAAGLVSMPAMAEEKPSPILTALSSTTISGYVNVSGIWNPGTGNANPPPYAFGAGKQDGEVGHDTPVTGVVLDVVQVDVGD